MNLTEPMRRELLWLASNRKELTPSLFDERRELYDGDPMDLGLRYVHLEQMGYVDTVMRVWDGGIGYARLTEEGYFAAKEIAEAEINSSKLPKQVKTEIIGAIAQGSFSVAASILLKFLGML